MYVKSKIINNAIINKPSNSLIREIQNPSLVIVLVMAIEIILIMTLTLSP